MRGTPAAMTTRVKIVLFLLLLVFPALLSALTAGLAFSQAKSVEFCSSCHTMTPWVDDVTMRDADSLAADHYMRRWIQRDQCYSCHSNYELFGTIEAKIKGMRHVIAYYVGERRRVALYEDFPNENCLQCHRDAKGFLEDDNHDPIEDILLGKDRCVECHEMVHGVEQESDEVDSDAEDADPSDEEDE